MSLGLAPALLLAVRSLTLPADPVASPVTIEVPKGYQTTIVLPEAFAQLRCTGGRTFGVEVAQYRPEGRLWVRPSGVLAETTCGLFARRDPDAPALMKLHLVVGGAPGASEVHLIRAARSEAPSPSGARRVALRDSGAAVEGPGKTVAPPLAASTAKLQASTAPAPLGAVREPARQKATAEPSKVAKTALLSPKPSPGPSEPPSSSTAVPVSAAPASAPSVPPVGRLAAKPTPSAGAPLASQGASATDPSPPPSAAPSASLATDADPRPTEELEGLDTFGLLAAKPMTIGRREGQPGRPQMILQDALKGERWVWLRFVLEGGAPDHVEDLAWERAGNHGQPVYVEQITGKDLLVVAQLPREEVTKKTRVTVKVSRGSTYKFAVSSPTFTNFLKGLF